MPKSSTSQRRAVVLKKSTTPYWVPSQFRRLKDQTDADYLCSMAIRRIALSLNHRLYWVYKEEEFSRKYSRENRHALDLMSALRTAGFSIVKFKGPLAKAVGCGEEPTNEAIAVAMESSAHVRWAGRRQWWDVRRSEYGPNPEDAPGEASFFAFAPPRPLTARQSLTPPPPPSRSATPPPASSTKPPAQRAGPARRGRSLKVEDGTLPQPTIQAKPCSRCVRGNFVCEANEIERDGGPKKFACNPCRSVKHKCDLEDRAKGPTRMKASEGNSTQDQAGDVGETGDAGDANGTRGQLGQGSEGGPGTRSKRRRERPLRDDELGDTKRKRLRRSGDRETAEGPGQPVRLERREEREVEAELEIPQWPDQEDQETQGEQEDQEMQGEQGDQEMQGEQEDQGEQGGQEDQEAAEGEDQQQVPEGEGEQFEQLEVSTSPGIKEIALTTAAAPKAHGVDDFIRPATPSAQDHIPDANPSLLRRDSLHEVEQPVPQRQPDNQSVLPPRPRRSTISRSSASPSVDFSKLFQSNLQPESQPSPADAPRTSPRRPARNPAGNGGSTTSFDVNPTLPHLDVPPQVAEVINRILTTALEGLERKQRRALRKLRRTQDDLKKRQDTLDFAVLVRTAAQRKNVEKKLDDILPKVTEILEVLGNVASKQTDADDNMTLALHYLRSNLDVSGEVNKKIPGPAEHRDQNVQAVGRTENA
ncbi:hypothetical protein CONPUDRAFT_77556 [Coniophora puteana RWD-64-598 SS2]|uniref:Zn(2)-C6 fungal-type domain-containing protein n=1 Tax=Coniophora puteana (strain RWD-64-598) TaxID=741705 RepID=A0A5M3M979_CONPW|nr:uncharacterized protein CONPUDRAFT_77556 [Coniophora puteana RWD-64-598 SS2]EIW75350.1 hypothetical protein CONPUDRAFT_77556 [Coniophora puteana RWD-64-598 SS2]